MSEAKHTPGPWRVASGDVASILAPSPFRKASFIQVIVFDGDRYVYQSPGDARLIATAPELLANLNTLVAMAEDYMTDPGEPDHLMEALEGARAAIAKATGA